MSAEKDADDTLALATANLASSIERRRIQSLDIDPALESASDATRRVISSLLEAGRTSSADLAWVAERLNEVADHLDQHKPAVRERLIDMWSGQGPTHHDPATGLENAIAPPLRLYDQPDGSVSGSVVLGMPYQGPPGHVHGGISALLLDHALGMANDHAGRAGMTARLTLQYRRPVPLLARLTVTARQTGVDGRKIFATGEIRLEDGSVAVEAEGLFVEKRLVAPS